MACKVPVQEKTTTPAQEQSTPLAQEKPALPANVRADHSRDPVEESESALKQQIIEFSYDEGTSSNLQHFQRLPRNSLISTLHRIRDKAEADDPIRVQVAFLLCKLRYQYPKNRAIVIDGFKNTNKYEHLPKEDAFWMINKLISGGDDELLTLAFEAAPRSDGALSEMLEGTYLDALEADPGKFLRRLAHMNTTIKRRVYQLIAYAMKDGGGNP
ncbi:MAG: hypothetical protein QOH96_851, partial [Blastocatellia bacterium]|nr:hypothetical protein [Blastocatellia bacterium]